MDRDGVQGEQSNGAVNDPFQMNGQRQHMYLSETGKGMTGDAFLQTESASVLRNFVKTDNQLLDIDDDLRTLPKRDHQSMYL